MDAKLVHASIRNYLGYILLNMKDIGMQYAHKLFSKGPRLFPPADGIAIPTGYLGNDEILHELEYSEIYMSSLHACTS